MAKDTTTGCFHSIITNDLYYPTLVCNSNSCNTDSGAKFGSGSIALGGTKGPSPTVYVSSSGMSINES